MLPPMDLHPSYIVYGSHFCDMATKLMAPWLNVIRPNGNIKMLANSKQLDKRAGILLVFQFCIECIYV